MSFNRIAGWSALVFAVCSIVSTAIAGTPPSITDPVGEVVEYYVDNQDALLVGNVLNTIAGIFFVLFFAGLYQRLRGVERQGGEPWAVVGILGAIFAGVSALIGQAASSVAIFRAGEETGGGGIVAAWYDLTVMGYTLTGFGIAVAAFGFGFALSRARLGPSWILALSDIVAVIGLVGASSAGSSSDAWGMFGFVAFIAFAVWAIVVGLWLAREGQAAAAPAA